MIKKLGTNMKTLIILILNLLIASYSYGSETKRFRVPMRSDSDKNFQTNVVIEYQSKLKKPIELNKFFKNINSQDEYANVFKIITMAAINDTLENIKPFISKDIKDINTPEKSFKSKVKLHRYMKKQSMQMELFDIITGVNKETFIIKFKNNKRSHFAGLSLIKIKEKIYWDYRQNGKDTIITILQGLRKTGGAFDTSKQKFNFSLELNDSIDAKLLFNGFKYTNNDKKIAPFSKLYSDLYSSLANDPIEKSASLFTKKSGQKLIKQIAKYPFMKEELAKQKKDRIVTFVMDAKPLYIVFSRIEHNTAKYIARFDYVYQEKDGSLKFTNHGYYDTFYSLILSNMKKIEKLVFDEK